MQALPNQTTTDFKLALQSNSNDPVSIVVTDMYGRKAFAAKGSVIQNILLAKTLFPALI